MDHDTQLIGNCVPGLKSRYFKSVVIIFKQLCYIIDKQNFNHKNAMVHNNRNSMLEIKFKPIFNQ